MPCAPGSLGSLRSSCPGQASRTHNRPHTPQVGRLRGQGRGSSYGRDRFAWPSCLPKAVGGIKEPRGAVSAERLEGGTQGIPPPWPGPLYSSASSPTPQVTGSSGLGGMAPVGPRALFFTPGVQAVLRDPAPPSPCLSFLSAGSWAQSGLTQEASVSRSLGQSVTLTCTGSSNNVGFYGAGWSQHRPGAAPRTVVLGSSRPSGLPARLSGSCSGSTTSLSISGLQAADEADYYCSLWARSLSAPAVPRAVGKGDKNLPLADGSLW